MRIDKMDDILVIYNLRMLFHFWAKWTHSFAWIKYCEYNVKKKRAGWWSETAIWNRLESAAVSETGGGRIQLYPWSGFFNVLIYIWVRRFRSFCALFNCEFMRKFKSSQQSCCVVFTKRERFKGASAHKMRTSFNKSETQKLQLFRVEILRKL